MDHALVVLVFVAALGSATVGGIFYGFSSFVMKALARLAPEQGVAAMNSINVVVINPSFMLAFMATALICLLLAAGSYFWWNQTGGWLVLVGALLHLAGSVGLTMILHQPMNLKLAGLQPAQAIAYWPEYLETWIRWNHVRSAAPLLSAAMFIAALVLRR
jgi:uncharacterized membrane protein